MQIRADFTKEKLMNEPDPLALACFPLGKIKLLADMFWGIDRDELQTGNVFNDENIHAMHDMLKDSCKDIELLIDVANKQCRDLKDQHSLTGE